MDSNTTDSVIITLNPVISVIRRKLHRLSDIRKRDLAFMVRRWITRARPLNVTVKDVNFRMTPTGSVALWVWLYHHFEDAEVGFVLDHLEPGDVFLDVGSNSGYYALAAGRKFDQFGSGQVYALEPSQWTFNLLQRNIWLNRLSNVFAFRLALANYDGEATLHINAPGKDGLNTLGRPVHPEARIVGSEEIPVARLDTFLLNQCIDRVDLMKIDCEGAELLVLQGAPGLLSRADAPLILYEQAGWTSGFDYQPSDITRLLNDCGFQLFTLNESANLRPMAAQQEFGNFNGMVVAVKPSHREFYKALI